MPLIRYGAILVTLTLAAAALAQPALTSVEPASAPPWERVTLSGSGLAAVEEVRFGGAAAPFVVASDGCVIATVPAEAKTGVVTVVSGGKEAARVPFRVEASYSVDLELPDQSPRPPHQFMRFRRPDGTEVAYFAAGDRYLERGFGFLDRYWSGRTEAPPDVPRGRPKAYLPPILKRLRHEPSESLMRHFADEFFAAQHPETKLVPYEQASWSAFAREEGGDDVPVYVIVQVSDHFLRWFPDDPEILSRSAELARGVVRHFDACGGGAHCGVHNIVTAGEGRPKNSITRVTDYGGVTAMVAAVGRRTGDASLVEWARRKQEFIWTRRLAPEVPLYADTYTPEGPEPADNEPATSDSDTLYNVRRVFELYTTTGDRRYLDRALRVTDFWYERAWNAEWGHFVRKLNPDGTQATDVIYGDAMYNTLWVLVHAYRETGQQKYLERLTLALRHLVSMGSDGLVPRHLQRSGLWQERGVARTQSMFVDILLEAYDASGDSTFLCEAERYADTILSAPDRAVPYSAARAYAGAALLRLAQSRSPVHRLELPLPGASHLRLETAAGVPLLQTSVDADVAVLYAPRGTYRVVLTKGGVRRAFDVTLDGDRVLSAGL